ncbi:MAG: Tn3 family transposase [Rhodoferax ferrireducens]|uniref:Tn3 family transposase n=2 Tax=Pseudomonadota TaxID=1224 RepID=A0A1Y1QS52_9GAMM|nr:MAG: Tn3 family transposase [Rhodoferax ferrireducens]OQX12227.1 MAG: Tn3 family transposase [Thiothrix lacustris]
MRGNPSKRLTILSDAEKTALYGLPEFDDFQRVEFFAMTDAERSLAMRRRGLEEQIYCLLQIGYFKAKQAFFHFPLNEAPPDDVAFLMQRYFPGKEQALSDKPLSKRQYYAQRDDIAALLGYRLCSDDDLPALLGKAILLARTDVSPTFLLAELMVFLIGQRIVRPGYTTLQDLITKALATERDRLEQLVESALTATSRDALQQLLVRENTLSDLAALKQDAKSFRYRQMGLERQKRLTLAPLYIIAKALLPSLEISQLNIAYYASLANYYTIYDLRRLKSGQTYLYLLCYAWQRYRQLTDNVVEAFGYHTRQLEDDTKAVANQQAAQIHNERQQATPRVGELLLLYVDDTLDDVTPFGTVRHRAFRIMPEERLRSTGKLLTEKPVSQMDLRWQAVDKQSGLCTKNLRSLAMALDFESCTPRGKVWLAALRWMKTVFARQQRLTKQPLEEVPLRTIPTRLRSFLLDFDPEGKPVGLRGDRYEFWIYRQLRKRLDVGDIYLDDSVQHRRFADDLVSMENKADVLKALNIPWLRQPVDATLDALFTELDTQWRAFDEELRNGKLKHLEFDPDKQTLTWHRPKADKDKQLQQEFYGKLQARDIADVFRFVNEQCHFLSAMTPLQPRYAKKIADEDSLMAVIIAQAMNHGNFSMAETCDIPYHVLDATHQQHLRPATLIDANDKISNFIASLPIFPYYSIGMDVLYGSVDGQKFASAKPTLKARHSRKYFGRDRGVVAFTLLANHVALQTELLGANQHESYWVFDICYNNTSDIVPTTITGDMHCINMANFAILYWFGMNLAPRFTNLQAQLKHLYCGSGQEGYSDFLIQPVGQIDRHLIASEKVNMDHIAATLGLKEMSQSVLMRKICTLSGHHRTRKAIFEFDKLIRTIYTLRYLRDPQLQRDVHRSENRIESYHQLRSTIAKVNGKKELAGRTDLDVAISNQCGRLIANIVIAYNSMLLSGMLNRYLATGNEKALDLLRRISPAAWQHLHFLGHYAFRDKRHPIDLEAILAGIDWE